MKKILLALVLVLCFTASCVIAPLPGGGHPGPYPVPKRAPGPAPGPAVIIIP